MIVHLPADATPTGTLLLYPDADRDGDPTTLTLTSAGQDTWSADDTGLTGRWWPSVSYTLAGDGFTLPLPSVDLPDDPEMVVTPEEVATKAGLALPLTGDQRDLITEAILDAQADVVAYLGRAIIPAVYTEAGRYDDGTGRWNLTPLDDPVIEVQSVTAELDVNEDPTGYFTITYLAGLNAKTDPRLRPIRRFVKEAALNAPEVTRLWRTTTKSKGEVRSVSTDGQSISYGPATLGGGGNAGSGTPGALPTLASLDAWRVAGRRVFQRRTTPPPPWPYSPISPHGPYGSYGSL